jgi:hypothetical protein
MANISTDLAPESFFALLGKLDNEQKQHRLKQVAGRVFRLEVEGKLTKVAVALRDDGAWKATAEVEVDV